MSEMETVKPNPCPACGQHPKRRYEGEYYCDNHKSGCWVAVFISVLPLEYWNRLRLAPAASDETIPVRIAVVVGEGGMYGASGCNGLDDSTLIGYACGEDEIKEPRRVTFITALAYKPQPQPAMEVQGDSESQ